MDVGRTGRRTVARAQFRVGEVVRHRLHDYRGVVVDMDAAYSGDRPTAKSVAQKSEQPWYLVLVDDADHADYVAEQNLEATGAATGDIRHPDLAEHFQDYADGRYRPRATLN